MGGMIRNEAEKIRNIVSKQHPTYEELAYKLRIEYQELAFRLHHLKKSGTRFFEVDVEGKKLLYTQSQYEKMLRLNRQILVKNGELVMVVEGDMHAGNKRDNKIYINETTEFVLRNNIKYVTDLGDMIQGIDYYTNRTTIPNEIIIPIDRDEQIEYLNKIIPYDPSIERLCLAGNHDLHTENGVSYDFISDFIAKTGRTDIRLLGFEDAILKINNDSIRLCHGIRKGKIKNRSKHKPLLVLYGGSHVSDYDICNSTYIKVVPTLSDVSYHKDENSGLYLPGNEEKKPAVDSNGEVIRGVYFPGFTVLRIHLNSKYNIEEILLQDYMYVEGKTEPQPLPIVPIPKYRTRR